MSVAHSTAATPSSAATKSSEAAFAETTQRHYSASQLKISPDRGVVMCVGKRKVHEATRMLWYLRRVWQSELGFGVAHCDDLSAAEARLIQSMDPSAHVVNLCAKFPAYGMQESESRWKLRGYYCKLGAVLASPFVETLLVDGTVVWLKPPSVLFSSPGE